MGETKFSGLTLDEVLNLVEGKRLQDLDDQLFSEIVLRLRRFCEEIGGCDGH